MHVCICYVCVKDQLQHNWSVNPITQRTKRCSPTQHTGPYCHILFNLTSKPQFTHQVVALPDPHHALILRNE
jgi:hypothetical protein